jgi:hypothetical protein
MVNSNNSIAIPFEACFAWRGLEGRVIAVYKVEPEIEQADGSVQGRVVEFVQCRIGEETTLHRDLDSISSPSIRSEIQQLIGRSFKIPREVRLGGVLYVGKP